uniref:Uncharacterized protein LOC111118146 n=1 Tax=Crassostrea virginica TaxID=6565 RepID=A0A8B8CBX4_CRAVI|nr:uncharacterized protein LOC111118146 [Crassostrea virginica]
MATAFGYPIHQPLPSSAASLASSEPDSRFDTSKKWTTVDMLAQDKLFQWTECRIWINASIVNDIREQGGAEQKTPTPAPDRSAVNAFLRDPKKEKTGELLKQRYCETPVGLHGSAYFVFGLPRVKRIVKDLNDDLDINQKADDRPREDRPENRSDSLRETRNDRFGETRQLGEILPDYKLGESRIDYKLGESRPGYKLGESRNDYKFEENQRLGEGRNNYKEENPPEYSRGDFKLGESRADYKLGESRADYKLGESRTDYKLGERRTNRLGDTRREEPRNTRPSSRRTGGENEAPSISRTTSGRQDDRKPNPLGQSAAYDLSSGYRDDLRQSRRARPEVRASEEPNQYASRVSPDRGEPANDKKSWAVDPPLYASRVLPDRRPDPRERYDDIQSWRPQDQSPRALPPPPPPPPPFHLAASGRYEGVVRR